MNPTQKNVFDYSLYFIDCILQSTNQSLYDWIMLPFPVGNWAELIGNPFIREQCYNVDKQAALAAENIPHFNQGQHAAFDEIIKAVDEQSGQTFFLHGPGGTRKTFTYTILCYHFCSKGKIVLCVALSGIAVLLLIGGRTAHSCFKIPLKIHKNSMCPISKNDELADLLHITDLIIWDEAPMQYCHIHECVNRTFQDIRGNDKLFGGICGCFW